MGMRGKRIVKMRLLAPFTPFIEDTAQAFSDADLDAVNVNESEADGRAWWTWYWAWYVGGASCWLSIVAHRAIGHSRFLWKLLVYNGSSDPNNSITDPQ